MTANITNKRAIILTGTIVPNSIYTQYNDANLRLKEYLQAIEFYCAMFGSDDVFFIENSDFDLENNDAYKKVEQKVKFTTLRWGRSAKHDEGKGYQEFEMLDRTVEKLDGYASFIKITGRYFINNARQITELACPGLVIDLNRRQKYAQTYIMYFTREFYMLNLKNEYLKVNDSTGKYIEHVLYEKISSTNLLQQCRLFHKTPMLSGVTGSYGKVLKRNYFRTKIRNTERFFYNLLNIKSFFY